ncbi:kinase-like domain-containing protein [Hyaloraphidium curvatum]|nr:kinase-like domain-containing protein [Hyaloraphidium curvatum]
METILKSKLPPASDLYDESIIELLLDALRRREKKIRRTENTNRILEANDVVWDPTKRLGVGGFGYVYEGTLCMTTEVAVKVLRDEASEKLAEDLQREVRTWEGLVHPHVLPLIGYCVSPQPLMVTQLMRNGSMRKYLASRNWDFQIGKKLLFNVVTGMSYLHARHVLHGDLKCDNVLVDHGEVAVITDFGLSRISQTVGGTAGGGGTTRYMAPEMLLQGHPIHKPSDVYAFAMLTYEVISAGRKPFSEATHDGQIFYALSQGGRPSRPVGSPDDDKGDELWDLIQRCWHQDPSVRPTFLDIYHQLKNMYGFEPMGSRR